MALCAPAFLLIRMKQASERDSGKFYHTDNVFIDCVRKNEFNVRLKDKLLRILLLTLDLVHASNATFGKSGGNSCCSIGQLRWFITHSSVFWDEDFL